MAVLVISAPVGAAGFESITGTYNSQEISFNIMFSDPRPVSAGWQFQLFLNIDNLWGTGYARGYDRIVRGVEFENSLYLPIRDTLNGGGPGGWGPALGMVRYSMPSVYQVQVQVPIVPGVVPSGALIFGFESYLNGRIVDSAYLKHTVRGSDFDCNNNGVADQTDILNGTSADCDGNGIPDECDIATGLVGDCNLNGSSDSCDIAWGLSEDCTSNGVPDECEADCNGNGIADSCDLLGGTSEDCDGNGVPDECEPLARAVGSRYIAVHPRAGTAPVAIRINGTTFDGAINCLWLYVQADGSLGENPVYRLPSQWCTVHVTGREIRPSSTYLVYQEGGSWHPPATVTTGVWGDIDQNGLVNFTDIQFVIAAYTGWIVLEPGQADLAPCAPNRTVNTTDIQTAVLAYLQFPFASTQCTAPCP